MHTFVDTHIHTRTHTVSSMKRLIKNDSNLTVNEAAFRVRFDTFFVMFFDPMKMYLKYSTARSFDYCIVNLHFRSLEPKMSKL